MNKYIYILLTFVLTACSAAQKININKLHCEGYIYHINDIDYQRIGQYEILSIDTHKDVYSFKCLDINNFDTISVISYKENLYHIPFDTSASSNIQVGGIYSFELTRRSTLCSFVLQSQYIIAKTDTLWRGALNTIPPAYYIVDNGLGLECWSSFLLNEKQLINDLKPLFQKKRGRKLRKKQVVKKSELIYSPPQKEEKKRFIVDDGRDTLYMDALRKLTGKEIATISFEER
jgi:hypothetical protein